MSLESVFLMEVHVRLRFQEFVMMRVVRPRFVHLSLRYMFDQAGFSKSWFGVHVSSAFSGVHHAHNAGECLLRVM